MFRKVKNYLVCHKKKFVFGGIFLGGSYLFLKYFQNQRKWQEKETKEYFERARKQQHYESIERTCNQTALNMTPNLRDAVATFLKTEELIQQLKLGTSNKIKIWDELKILAFTKLSAVVYACSLLIVTLRIQLNLIGGYMFHDTTNESENVKITSAIQEKYLGLCQFFMEDGVQKLCKFIEEKVKLVLEDKSLKAKLTIQDIEQIFWAIQMSISNDKRDPCKSLPLYILPESFKRDDYGLQFPAFDNMIVETSDLLESEEIVHLTQSCISNGFSHVTDQVAEFFRERNDSNPINNDKIDSKPITNGKIDSNPVPSTSSKPDVLLSAKPVDDFVNLTTKTIPMAKLIPIINGLVQSHSSKDIPHTWIQKLILMDSLKVMGANIYEAFSSKE